MGVGIGTIRVWRQEDSGKKPCSPKAKEAKPASAPAAQSKPVATAQAKSAAAKPQAHLPAKHWLTAQHLQPQFETIEQRLCVDLKLSGAHLAALTKMFETPRALAALLRAHTSKIATAADASLFLLMHRKQLDGFIDGRERHGAVDQLTELLIQWSNTPPEIIGIDFSEDCSISANQEIYLPIDGLRLLATSDPADLARQRQGAHYGQTFTLFERGRGFAVSFTLSRRVQVPTASLRPPPGTSLKDWRPPEIRLAPGQPRPHIVAKPAAMPQRNKTRVLYTGFAQSFGAPMRSMNWRGISGWGVSGGLPSLGKGSR